MPPFGQFPGGPPPWAGAPQPPPGPRDQNAPDPGYPDPGFPNQNFPDRGFPDQGFPDQRFPGPDFRGQEFPGPDLRGQGFPDQSFPDQGFRDPGFRDPGFPDQQFPPPGPGGPGPVPPQGAPWGPPPQHPDSGPRPFPGAPGHGELPGPPPGAPYGSPPHPGAFTGQHSSPAALDEVALLRKARRAPHSGWRRAVHRMSGGSINPGDSPDALHYAELIERVNRPVRGDYRIAVLSLKGGVGKTTTAVGLGSIFSSLRGDRVIAVDANPDLGTLGQRVPQQTRSTVRDLLADNSIYRYSDVRAHTSQSPSRLEVLASERDPAVAEAFSEEDYRGVMKVLQRFYNIIITDCGTGLSHSAMNGVLDLANALILVSSPAIDGARSAGATLDWLQAHGYGHLVSRAVVVLSSSRSGSSTIDTKQLIQHFLTRCRAVQMIPFDDHLAEGAEVDLDLLNKHTHRSLVELAAVVADDFSSTTLRRVDPFLG
ncbi:MinD/ParA family ATP-binding protein [Williamsia deligens]|uniref:MinD/ParA family protein n=1 Tax=Williamsia deligens TaxID=321325 RepID=A0ABW3G2U4_9NOCA|nr:MinD/ParA family protein [Williamsia deligens]